MSDNSWYVAVVTTGGLAVVTPVIKTWAVFTVCKFPWSSSSGGVEPPPRLAKDVKPEWNPGIAVWKPKVILSLGFNTYAFPISKFFPVDMESAKVESKLCFSGSILSKSSK